MKQFFRITLALTVLLCGSVALTVSAAPSADPLPPSVPIFWNRLGSVQEVQNSEIGPGIQLTSYMYADWQEAKFEPAKFDNGLFVNHDINHGWSNDGANFFAIDTTRMTLTPERGTIEFWFKFRYGAETINHAYFLLSGDQFVAHRTDCNYFTDTLIAIAWYGWDYGAWGKRFSFGLGNDPDWSREVHTPDFSAGPGGYLAFKDGDMMHFAAVWDVNGIAGSSDTMRLYVNGNVEASGTETWPVTSPFDRYLWLGSAPNCNSWDHFYNAVKGVTDNLMIWNYAKTDFSDRFEEGFNQPPVANAGGPYTVPEGDSITLDGTGSNDVDPGDTLTYAWDLDNDGVYETPGATASFTALDGPASQPVALQVCDPQAACDTDATTVGVTTVAPTAQAGTDVTVYRNEPIPLAGTWADPAAALDEPYVWAWDLDGDGVADASGAAAYGASAPATTSFATEGVYDLTFTVTDADGASGLDTVRITVRNHAPVCTAAAPNPALLWPPNNKFVPVAIGGTTDADGDALILAITSIRQDEPVGKGNSAPDGKGIGTAAAELRAEKLGSGNGRFYHVSFTANDGHGGACTGVVRVAVPHDQAKPPVDGGPLYDSTVPTP
jgi:hypothetical protein